MIPDYYDPRKVGELFLVDREGPQNRDRRRPRLAAAATQEGQAIAENILRDLRGDVGRSPITTEEP